MSTLSDFEPAADVPELAQEMIDRIQEVDQLSDHVVDGEIRATEDGEVPDGGQLAPWELPGFGGVMQDDCGEQQPHFCDECGRVHDHGRSCQQSRCEMHWESFVIDKAERHVARGDAVARTLGARTGTAHHKHHVAFMLPPDWRPTGDEEERYRKTWEVIRDIISDIWGHNAMVAYHGWSGSGYGEDEGVGDDMGEWADRLDPENRDWYGDVRDELYARPHFHAIVVAPRIPGGQITKSVYEQTGWVIKRIYDEDTNRSIGGEDRQEEMESHARATTYTLSHMSVRCPEDDDNDAKVHTCGSEWWNYDGIETREDSKRDAKRAVRAVAPTTLGVDEDAVRCDDHIAPERAPDADEYHTDDHDCGCEGECSCGSSDPADAVAGDTVSTTGTVVEINDSAGTVTLQSGTDQWEVSVDAGAEIRVGDKKTASGTLTDDGEIVDGELEDPRVECQGAIRHVKEAGEFVEDDDWVDRSQFADETVRWFEWWTGKAGMPPDPPPR